MEGAGEQRKEKIEQLKLSIMLKRIDFVNSLKDLNETDLRARIQEDELRLKKLEFAHAISPLENPMSIRALRKDVARLKTVLAQKVAQKAEAVQK
jgi:large subunit ribosomal protein L29